MGFFEELSEAADELLEELEQTGTYKALAAEPGVSVRVAWARSDLAATSRDEGRESEARGVVQVHQDDAPSPDERDTFVLDGSTWAVERIEATKPLAIFHVFKIDQRRYGGADVYAKR